MSQINIGGLTIDKFYLGNYSDVKIYLGNVKLYPQSTPPTPVSSCYEVISTPMTSYSSTTYDSVYSFSDKKWYMKNNLSQYEEYGIYDIVEDISSATTYDGKLAIVGTTEYQYSGGSWSVVGTYEDVSVTYTIDDTIPSPYVGQELATTFKIPYADVEALRRLNFIIRTEDAGILEISTSRYRYRGSQIYNGTVTNDGEYYYFALPSEAPQSIIINDIDYGEYTPIHLIVGSKQASVEYAEKETPTANVYNTVEDMDDVGCPTVGVGQYGVVGNNVYQFEESEEWVNKAKSSFKFVAKYNDGNANVIECNTSNELSSGETKPYYLSNNAMTEAYIGDCVTSIGNSAFRYCSSLTSIDIPSGVTSIGFDVFRDCTSLSSIEIPNSVTSIGIEVFNNCTSLTSCTIGSGVTSIGMSTFRYCSSLTSIDIPSGITSIGNSAFRYCSSLTSITMNSTTPPKLVGANAFESTNNCPIYVPSGSVNAYKSATDWSKYASRIQAIP